MGTAYNRLTAQDFHLSDTLSKVDSMHSICITCEQLMYLGSVTKTQTDKSKFAYARSRQTLSYQLRFNAQQMQQRFHFQTRVASIRGIRVKEAHEQFRTCNK